MLAPENYRHSVSPRTGIFRKIIYPRGLFRVFGVSRNFRVCSFAVFRSPEYFDGCVVHIFFPAYRAFKNIPFFYFHLNLLFN